MGLLLNFVQKISTGVGAVSSSSASSIGKSSCTAGEGILLELAAAH